MEITDADKEHTRKVAREAARRAEADEPEVMREIEQQIHQLEQK